MNRCALLIAAFAVSLLAFGMMVISFFGGFGGAGPPAIVVIVTGVVAIVLFVWAWITCPP